MGSNEGLRVHIGQYAGLPYLNVTTLLTTSLSEDRNDTARENGEPAGELIEFIGEVAPYARDFAETSLQYYAMACLANSGPPEVGTLGKLKSEFSKAEARRTRLT